MPYATEADLLARYGSEEILGLSSREDASGAGVVAAAIADADAEIDSYLGAGGYTTPLSSPPASVLSASCVVARYYLHKDRPTEKVQQAYEAKAAWLRDVARGVAVIDSSSGDQQGTAFAVAAPDETFTETVVDAVL